MKIRSPEIAAHHRMFRDLLVSIMLGNAGPAEWRVFFAAQIRKGLRGPDGVGIHPDAADPRIPDEIIALEARYCVLACPSLRQFHPEARSLVALYTNGDPHKCEGLFSWNCWVGGTEA